MAAEYDDLPPEVRAEVDAFTDVNVRWLSEVLSICRPQLSDDEKQQQALAIYAAVEGAQLVARGRDDIGVFDATVQAYRTAGLLP
jgi:TetR/AcrR family transcriptional repressor of nem operon